MKTYKVKKYLIILVAVLMITSLFTVILSGQNAGTSAGNKQVNEASAVGANSPANTVMASSMPPLTGQNVTGLLKDNNVPSKYAFVPNLNSPATMSGSTVNPGYKGSPSPIGVADFGLYNKSGVLTGYSYRTSSFEGTVTINNMSAFYMLNNAPETVSFQLNSVLNSVALLGSSNYVFWTNSVMLYSTRTNQISFVSNIWNFSSPSMNMQMNNIVQGNGKTVPGLLYYYNGPGLNVTFPFTVHLYLNSTVLNRNSAVYFNYSVLSDNVTHSGTYDLVQFNSTYGMPSGVYTAPRPYYLVDGNQMTPTGKTLNDAEFVMGGPGSGSMTSIYNLSSTMSLKYYSSGTATYNSVNSSYDFGSNVGEAVNGVSVYWTSDKIAHLSYGPTFLYGLWNTTKSASLESSSSGYVVYRGLIKPSNAIMFVSSGGAGFDSTVSSWAPIPTSGFFVYALTPSQSPYQAMVFMSNYDEHSFTLNPVSSYNNVTMAVNLTKGIYTPLMARSNNQLSNISASGNGSATSPYVIEHYQYVTINSIFSKYSSYLYPVFPGVMIMDTNAGVRMNYMPNLQIMYSPEVSSMLGNFGLPDVNYLPMLFYNTSNVSIYGSAMITGWFSSNLASMPVANVMFWNCTNSLVANNQFSTIDSSLLFYNDNSTNSSNVVWGNTFSNAPMSFSSYFSEVNLMNGPLGLTVYGSHNLIYNNYFSVQNTAYSPNHDIYTGSQVFYDNMWNVTKQTPSNVNLVNGYQLFGSIIRLSYQGGNYWWNYNGTTSYYNASGMIANGADYVPLSFPTFVVTFTEMGLSSGESWGVNIDGLSSFGTSSAQKFNLVNGTYTFTVVKPSDNYGVSPMTSVIHVFGQNVNIPLTFTLITYTVTFSKQGVNVGIQWAVTLNGMTKNSSSNKISFTEDNGTYDFSVSGTAYYLPVPAAGDVLVFGSNISKIITFINVTHTISFTQNGLPSGSTWSVTLAGNTTTSTTGTISFYYLKNGTYDFSISPPSGYSSKQLTGSVFVFGNSVSSSVNFYQVLYRVTFVQSGLVSGTTWNVSMNGHTIESTGSFISFNVPNGTYFYNISKVTGYSYNLTSGNTTVNGANASFVVGYSKIPNPWISVGLFFGGIAVGFVAGMLMYFFFLRRVEVGKKAKKW